MSESKTFPICFAGLFSHFLDTIYFGSLYFDLVLDFFIQIQLTTRLVSNRFHGCSTQQIYITRLKEFLQRLVNVIIKMEKLTVYIGQDKEGLM
jgi:hypothetical protein